MKPRTEKRMPTGQLAYAIKLPDGRYYNPFHGPQPSPRDAAQWWTYGEAFAHRSHGEVVMVKPTQARRLRVAR